MRLVHQIAAWLLATLGVVHISVTPLIFESLTQRAMYFASAGLMMIFVALLNLILNRNHETLDRVSRGFVLTANLLCILFGAFAIITVPEPQAYFGLLLILTLAATAFVVAARRTKGSGAG